MGIVTPSYRAACGAMVGALVLTVSSVTAMAGGSQLVSARNPAVPLAVPGNGNSAGPIVSADGRYVVFVSTANDLVPGDNSLFTGDVFVRDRQSNTIVLVSGNISGTGGGNGSSIADAISADGRYILFESDASDLTAASDANGVSDVFVRDLLLGTTSLVSVSTNGSAGNAGSSTAVMTPDGRYVAFVSFATNLVANDTNGIADIFVRDLLSGTTILASPGATIVTAGTTNVMDTPVITPDGRFVAFFSSARNLVGNLNSFPGDVYLRDLMAGTTIRPSTNAPASYPGGPQMGYKCYLPTISDDGRFVAFRQFYNNQVARLFRFDSLTGMNTQINTNSGGFSLDNGMIPPAYIDDVFGPELSHDGRYVVYAASTNSVPAYIVQWDGQTLSTTVLSQNISGGISTNTFSCAATFTPDGRYMAFLCNGTNMVTNTVSNGFHVYLRDLQVGTNFLVGVDTNGVGSIDITGTVPSISSNGNFVAFASQDAGFVNGDNNLALDVFLRDMTNGNTALVSARGTNVNANAGGAISSMSQTSITPDGHWLVFSSRSEDLVTNDANNDQDVFVRDLVGGTNILVSVGTNGSSAQGGWSGYPVISANGRYVAFVSAATNIVPGDVNNAADIFLRDLQAGTTVRVNVDTNGGVLGTGDSSSPVISQDGRYVAFVSKTNLGASIYNPFWRDVVSNQTVTLASANSQIFSVSMSANGRYVEFNTGAPKILVWDTSSATYIYTNNIFGGDLSPDGTKLLIESQTTLTVTDLAANTNVFSLTAPNFNGSPKWSADGRFITFATSAVEGPGDNNSASDVFLGDLQTATITLVSMNSAHTGSGNAQSDSPTISGNGRFVVFRSFANNITSGITNSPNLFIFDRQTGSNALLTVESSPVPAWSTWVSKPAVNADGAVVAFQSLKPNLVSGGVDLNRVQDVFFQPQSPLSFADGDGDGIPDWWLSQYFGHPNGQVGDLSRAQDDADGDGMSNLQEYLTGTNPKNNSSVFRIQITPVIASTNATLIWPSVPGKSYRIQYKNTLADASWTDFAGNIYVSGGQVSITVPGNPSSRYYRVLAVN